MFVESNPEQEALIVAGIGMTDHAIKQINGRTLIPANEVTDWLLDIRQSLDRYYITKTHAGETVLPAPDLGEGSTS